MNYIAALREQSLKNEEALDDGLMPPGFPDGGLGPRYCYEYTNTYWNLVGVRAAIQAARWLGKDDQALRWREMYNDFYGTGWASGDTNATIELQPRRANHRRIVIEPKTG
jgi:hypothetical protein